jgi:tripartite-type tricarboxylate transporter receptor subunit TctC
MGELLVKRSAFLAVALALQSLLAVSTVAVHAQTAQWPQRNVRFIIPFGPGSGADISARLIADPLQQKWGKPVIIENRPGGDAMIAINAFVGAQDDHTLLYAAAASFVAHPYNYDTLSYSYEKDLLPIARISITLMAVGVPQSLGMANLKDFVAYAKANPGKLNSASVQGMSEIVFYGWMKREGLEIAKVPYRDIVQAPTDVAEGRLQVLMSSLAAQQPLVQAGKIKVLGLGSEHSPTLPGVPTITEAGAPALDHEGLIGVFGPRGMSLELRRKVGEDIVVAGKSQHITDRLIATAQLPALAGPDELTASVAKMNATLDAAAQALGMKRKL